MADAPPAVQQAQKLFQWWRGIGLVVSGCGGCGCLPSCGTVILAVLMVGVLLAAFKYACDDFLGGVVGWAESLAAKIGLTPGICEIFR